MATTLVRGKGLLARATTLLRQPLYANAGYLLGINLVGSLVGFVFWSLAARLYRPDDVGMASAVISAVALVSGIAGLGVGTGVVRFLPEARSPRRLLNTAFTFNAVMAILAGGVFLAGLSLWSPSLMALRQNPLYGAGFLAYTTAVTLGAVVQMTFVARRQAFYAFIQTCVVNSGRLLLVAVLAGLGAAGLVGSVTVAAVLAVSLSLLGFLPKVELGYRLRPGFSWPDLAAIIPYSLGNHITVLLAQTIQTLLPLVVLEMLGPASSGYTYIAWMLGSLLVSPGMSLAGSAFAEGSNAPHRLTGILARSVALALLLTLPAAMVLGVAAPWVLLLFGPSYAQSASGLLRWLSLAAPPVVLTGLYFTYLRVQKQIGRLVTLSVVMAAIALGVAIALMPRLGIASTGIGWLIGNGLVATIALGSVWSGLFRGREEEQRVSVANESDLQAHVAPLIVAAIPCYNEARFVGDVVRQTRQHVDTVVVVDDGSTDETVEVAQAAGAQVIQHPANLGPGIAARNCLQGGLDRQADVLVTLDGDGQHNPDEISDVIAPILAGEADLVIGSRFLGRYNNVAGYRRFGIDVITFLYNLGARTKITDGQSCFRAYNRRALETLRITEPGFGFSVETLVQARNAGLRIREASISCVYHEESHSMNPVIHGVGVALMVIKHRVGTLVRRLLGLETAE
jgi:O-antigen/teichoic acid export membrane protein